MTRHDLPAGTVTFLFTDVEGSTRLLEDLGPAAYADALAAHRRTLRQAFAANGGVEVDTQGDAFFVAFPAPPAAVAAAMQCVDGLEGGPIRVRIGIHLGRPHLTDEGYVGADVHKAARIAAAGHGGQVLLSKETRDLVEVDVADLGEHRLKDFAEPVAIFQLGATNFPPLKTISNTNLPRPASSFVGRERELEELTALLRGGSRLVTLTGPGGSGKTRLAIEAAAEVVPDFLAGVFWVGLAPLRDPALVPDAISQTLGARNGLSEHIGERELLLVLDNLEQVIGAAPELAALVESCPRLRVVVTSRELLRVRGEHEFAVPPLAEHESVELFCARARADPGESVRTLCRALDDLPLAIELAAARTSVLSPEQILERLSGRLDVLKGGRDAEPRQQTLRATIEWSYELLDERERQLFARLAVFRGGSTLAAAEDVAEAELDTIQSLVEKSLLRHTDGRFWMLETIREYADERLEETGVAVEVKRRHAAFLLRLAQQCDLELRAGDPEEGPVGVLAQEIDNIRAAVAFGLDAGDTGLVREITAALPMYWIDRGSYAEGRAWLDRALALDDVEDDVRRRLLSGLGTIAYFQGDHVTAVDASDEAASLAGRLGGVTSELERLAEQASAALMKGDLDSAESLFLERFALARAVDNGVATSSSRLNLAYIANKTERPEEAGSLLADNLEFVRSKGQARCEAATLTNIAEMTLRDGRPDECADDALLGATRALQIGSNPLAVYSLDLLAAAVAARGEGQCAAAVLAATQAAREAMGVVTDEDEEATRARVRELIGGPGGAAPTARAVDLPTALADAERVLGAAQP